LAEKAVFWENKPIFIKRKKFLMNAVLTFYNLLFISAYSFLLFIVFLHINSYNLKRFRTK